MLRFMARAPQTMKWSSPWYAMINPASFKESVAVHYASRQVLGLSHEVAQYVRTASRKISFDLQLSLLVLRQIAGDSSGPKELLKSRNWFESLLVPAGLGLAPPTVRAEWPGAELWFIGVVDSLSVEYETFRFDGKPMSMKLDVSMIETPDALMTSSRVLAKGLGFGSYGNR